ncbi:unnamed protein product [Durusdinium trenchii]|uniref:Uncharacterized protein n=2 Tax=Durusdinium trenchii TaxID=1381693 RepID=A0ABP0HXC9_9DINO
MEPITLLREPDGGLEGEEAASWAEDAGSFYRTMAEELLSLGRLSADIQWAPDVPLRAKRPAVVAKTPAPTGRAPAPVSVVVPVARREQVRREPVARRELPVAREVAEVTTKKPPHLASHATRPVPTGVRVGRGRTAPHQSAAQSRAGRRLRLGALDG